MEAAQQDIIKKYQEYLLKQGLSPATIERKLSVVKTYLTFLEKEIEGEKCDVSREVRMGSGLKNSSSLLIPDPQLTSHPHPINLEIAQKLKALGIKVEEPKPSLVSQLLIVKLAQKTGRGIIRAGRGLKSATTDVKKIRYTLPYALKYNRPNWLIKYQKNPVAKFVNLALLIVFCVALGIGGYEQFGSGFGFLKGNQPGKVLGTAPVLPPTKLSFQGRLTDQYGTPITDPTHFRFSIYNDPTASGSAVGNNNFLYEEAKWVIPDTDGIFNTLIGDTTAVDPTIFRDNQALWLGVTVAENAEMTDRQQIATVGYAFNSQYLQGYGIGTTNVGANVNEIPVIDAQGRLMIAAAGPTLQTTSGIFKIESPTLALMATTNSGNVGIGTSNPGYKLEVNGGLKVGNTALFSNNVTIGGTAIISSTKVGALIDSNNSVGSNGYILSSTGTGVSWTTIAAIGGNLPYVNNATNATLTRSGAGPYTLALNLSNANTWSASQTLTADTIFGSGANTGIWKSTGNVGIGTSTVTSGYIMEANGNIKVGGTATFSSYVGIGTTSPGTKLVVDKQPTLTDFGAPVARFTGGYTTNGVWSIGFGAQAIHEYSPVEIGYKTTSATNYGLGDLIFGTRNVTTDTAAAERLRITSVGNVGIGVTSPSSRLSLGANLATQGLLVYESGNNRAGLGVPGSDGSFRIFYGSNWAAGLTIGTISATDGTTWTENVRITTAGNVGIGTTGNKNKLDINGSLAVGSYAGYYTAPSNSLIVSGNVGIGTTSPTSQLEIYNSDNTTVKTLLQLRSEADNTGEGAAIAFNGYASGPIGDIRGLWGTAATRAITVNVFDSENIRFTGDGKVILATDTDTYWSHPAADKLMWTTGGTDRMIIDTNGNVGIGKTNPSQTLDVVGSANISVGLTAPKVTLTTGAQNSYILQSDASGNGTWVSPVGIGGTYTASNGITLSGSDFQLGGTLSKLTTINMNSNNFGFYGTGSVGIGTTSPRHILQIGSQNSGQSKKASIVAGNGGQASLKLVESDETNEYGFQIVYQGSPNRLDILSSGGNTFGDDSDFATSRIAILRDTGNVGIGTTAPSALTHISSTAAQDLFRVDDNGQDDTTPFIVDQNGNVGIGRTSPIQKLAVVGDTVVNAIYATVGDATGRYAVWGAGPGGKYGALGYKDLLDNYWGIYTNGNTYIGGNIGIGTTNPTSLLHVAGNAYVSNILNVGVGLTSPKVTLTTGANNGYLLQSDASGNGTWVSPVGIGGTYTASNGITLSGSNFKLGGTLTENTLITQGNFNTRFNLSGTGDFLIEDAGVPSFYVNDSGNVGVGTSAPTAGYKLDVQGNINTSGTAVFNSYVGIGITSPSGVLSLGTSLGKKLMLYDVGTLSTATGLGIQSNLLEVIGGNSSVDYTFGYGTSGSITRLMTIMGSGNVGIGTTGNKNKLDVNGTLAVGTYAGVYSAPASGAIISGNVGIGITSPSYKLQLADTAGAVNDLAIWINSNTDKQSSLYLGTNANVGLYRPASSNDFRIYNSGDRVTIQSTGNVGIGTTNPLALLHVEGQCVTGDTILKRRKKRRGQKTDDGEQTAEDGNTDDRNSLDPSSVIRNQSSVFSPLSSEFEDVRIDQIQPGDEVLTLDEKTGEFVIQKVNKLMDMGIKGITKITTVSGKTIRTTENHPYLVKTRNSKFEIRNNKKLDFAFVDETGIFDGNVYSQLGVGALIVKDNDLVLNQKLRNILLETVNVLKEEEKTFEFKFKYVTHRSLPYYLKLLATMEQYLASWEFSSVFEPRAKSFWRQYLSLVKKLFGKLNGQYVVLADHLNKPTQEKKTLTDLTGKGSIQKILQVESQGTMFLQVADILLGGCVYDQKAGKDECKKTLAAKVLEVLGEQKRAGVDPIYAAHRELSLARILTGRRRRMVTSQLFNRLIIPQKVKWVKVRDLAKGNKIATVDGWEEIKKIEHLPEEQVYDIEIALTHNFVANGIVAHNTYINGNLGIGTTSPGYKLEINGGLKVGNTALFSNNITVGGTGTFTSVKTGIVLDKDSQPGNNQQVLSSTGTGVDWVDISNIGIGGSGTTNYLPKFIAQTTLGLSNIFDNGTNVGIGTTSPATSLHVYKNPGEAGTDAALTIENDRNGTGNDVYLILDKTNGSLSQAGIQFNVGGGNQFQILDQNDILRFEEDGGSGFALSNTGKVGIGTTAPGYLLEVNGGLRVGNTALFSSNISVGGTINMNNQPIINIGNAATDFDGTGGLTLAGDLAVNGGDITSSQTTFNLLTATVTTLNIGSGATANFGGGYGSTGVSISQTGNIQANGTLTIDGASTLSGNVGISGTATLDVVKLTDTVLDKGNYSGANGYILTSIGTGVSWMAPNAVGIGTTYNAGNGLTLSANTFKLGGTLTELTKINMNSNDFGFYGTGNVGIGTTSPGNKLVIYSNTAASGISGNLGLTEIRQDAATNVASLYIQQTTAGGNNRSDQGLVIDTQGVAGSNALRIKGLGNDIFVVQNGGNVGIGTTGPGTQLEVAGGLRLSSGGAGFQQSTRYNSGNPYWDLSYYSSGSFYKHLISANYDGNVGIGTTNPTAFTHISSTANQDLFRIDDAGIGDTSPFVVDQNGNVGIGVTSPGGKLDVINATDGYIAGFGTNDGADNVGLGIYGYTSDYGTTYLQDTLMLYAGTTTTNLEIAAAAASGNIRFHTTGFGTGSSERMRIASDGKVGIGTTSPNTSFHSYSTVGNYQALFERGAAGDSTIQLKNTQNQWEIGIDQSLSNAFAISNSSTDLGVNQYLTILTGGNVGIGTTNPANLLDLSKDGTYIYATTIPGAQEIISSTSNDMRMYLGIDSTSKFAYIQSSEPGTDNRDLILQPNGGNGYVGIGTTNPGYSLDINGGLKVGNTALFSNNVSIGGTATLDVVKLTDTVLDKGNFSGANGYILTSTGTGVSWMAPNAVGIGTTYNAGNGLTLSANTFKLGGTLTELTTISQGNNLMKFDLTGTGDFEIDDNGVPAFYVNDSGNVGVGTSAPTSGYKLDVNGNFRVGATANFNSYVGIGTQTPLSTLHVSNSAGSELRLDTISGTNANSTLSFYENSTSRGSIYWDGVANDFVWSSSTGDISLLPSGNVGIGTTNPNISSLPAGSTVTSIIGSTGRGALELGTDATDADNLVIGDIRGVQTTADASYKDKAAIVFFTNGTTANKRGGAITFWTNPDNSATLTQRMTIDNSGNVGIGVTSPTAPLTVANASATDQLLVQQWGYQGDTGKSLYNLKLKQAVTTGVVRWVFDMTNSGSGYTDVLAFDRGKVGIGTTNPGYSLDINGGLKVGNTALFSNNVSIGGTVNLNNQPIINIGNANTDFDGTGGLTLAGDLAVNGGDITSSASTLNIGTGSTVAITTLDVNGQLLGTNNFAGTNGMVLTSTGTGVSWTTVASLSGGNAHTLDGLESTQFLRSDASDTFDAGNTLTIAGALDTNGNVSIADTDIALDGASTNFTATGNLSINTDDLFVQKSDGNVGIGTATPRGQLHTYDLEQGTIIKSLILENHGSDNGSGTAIYMGYQGGATDPFGIRLKQTGYPSSTRTGSFEIQVHGSGSGDADANWTTALKVASDGNIGIGTTSPLASLNVIAPSSGTDALVQQWGYTAAANNGQYNLKLKQAVTSNVVRWTFDQTNNSTLYRDVLTLDRGSVGIGTTNPGTKLEVSGTGNVFSTITSTDFNSPYLALQRGTNADAYTDWKIYNSSSNGNLTFGTGTNGSENQKVSIDTNGNVGIGTTDPGALLHLSFNSDAGLRFSRPASATVKIRASSDADAADNLQYDAYTHLFKYGNSDFMFINQSGNVGIGTTNPSHKLVVGAATSASVDSSFSILGQQRIGAVNTNKVPELAGAPQEETTSNLICGLVIPIPMLPPN